MIGFGGTDIRSVSIPDKWLLVQGCVGGKSGNLAGRKREVQCDRIIGGKLRTGKAQALYLRVTGGGLTLRKCEVGAEAGPEEGQPRELRGSRASGAEPLLIWTQLQGEAF